MEAVESNRQSPKVQCSDDVDDVKGEVSVKIEDDADEVLSRGSQRENRLTSIIDQLRCQSKMKGRVLILYLRVFVAPHSMESFLFESGL